MPITLSVIENTLIGAIEQKDVILAMQIIDAYFPENGIKNLSKARKDCLNESLARAIRGDLFPVVQRLCERGANPYATINPHRVLSGNSQYMEVHSREEETLIDVAKRLDHAEITAYLKTITPPTRQR